MRNLGQEIYSTDFNGNMYLSKKERNDNLLSFEKKYKTCMARLNFVCMFLRSRKLQSASTLQF